MDVETVKAAGPIVSKVVAQPLLHAMTGIALRPISFFPAQPSLPVAETRNGSLFSDRFDTDVHWYLPDFLLAADVDVGFAFSVRQTGQQSEGGQPYNVARLSITLKKQRPDQVVAFAEENPKAVLREISLQNLVATTTSSYVDENGNSQQRNFRASTVQDNGDGSLSLVFDDSILGANVLAVYQDLRKIGQAAIVMSADFQCWSQPRPHLMFASALKSAPLQSKLLMVPHTIALTKTTAASVGSIGVAKPNPPPNLVQGTLPYSENLPLRLKYAAADYQLRYTITTEDSESRVIVGTGDLSSFDQLQNQFVEFEALGPLNIKYPSIARAFLGSISKTLILIPQRYSIVRGKNGCSATCLALVDSSPSAASKCKFEFDFVIAPEVSAIELAKLSAEIAGYPDVKQITFAEFLQTTPPSTLNTSFASNVQFGPGSDAHTFAVTVTVGDADLNTPAVANANLFIVRLCAQSGTDLIGALSLKLDDGYPDAVQATIDLNFAHTSMGDELLPQIDESTATIKVTNQSPLDLWIQKYALIQGASLTEFDTPTLVSAGGSFSLPLPQNSAASTFVYDAQLALPPSMNAAAVTKFLTIQSADVQNTQYVVTLATNVDWAKVASLFCVVTFPTLPAVQPWQTTLTASLQVDTTRVQIPIENAVFTFPGIVEVTVNAIDPNAAPFTLSLQNDFQVSPTITLLQSQLVRPISPMSPVSS